MFKDNKLFGSGPRSFRYLCKDKKFAINKESCSTHPHNYYFEILSELGLIGFLFLFSVYLFIIYNILNLFFKKKVTINNNYKICLMGIFLVNLWPIMPTGSFFNNWTSIILYIPISFYLLSNSLNKNS
jgi:O-antigen ligase